MKKKIFIHFVLLYIDRNYAKIKSIFTNSIFSLLESVLYRQAHEKQFETF